MVAVKMEEVKMEVGMMEVIEVGTIEVGYAFRGGLPLLERYYRYVRWPPSDFWKISFCPPSRIFCMQLRR